MGRFVGWRALLLCGVVSVFLVFGVSGALADDFHGIAIAKQCASPVKVGDPHTCALQILNVVDIPAHDTLRVTGFSDNVHAAGGDVHDGRTNTLVSHCSSGTTTSTTATCAGVIGGSGGSCGATTGRTAPPTNSTERSPNIGAAPSRVGRGPDGGPAGRGGACRPS